jgi:hypothetical protein
MKLISLILVLVELLNFQAFPHKFRNILEKCWKLGLASKRIATSSDGGDHYETSEAFSTGLSLSAPQIGGTFIHLLASSLANRPCRLHRTIATYCSYGERSGSPG